MRHDTLVVCHQAVLRVIWSYFLDRSTEDAPHLATPLHCVLELRPGAYGCEVRSHNLEPWVEHLQENRDAPLPPLAPERVAASSDAPPLVGSRSQEMP